MKTILTFFLVLLTLNSYAHGNNNSTTSVHACSKPNSGLYITNPYTAPCTTGYRTLHWPSVTSRGLQGPPGPQGPRGEQGPQGDPAVVEATTLFTSTSNQQFTNSDICCSGNNTYYLASPTRQVYVPNGATFINIIANLKISNIQMDNWNYYYDNHIAVRYGVCWKPSDISGGEYTMSVTNSYRSDEHYYDYDNYQYFTYGRLNEENISFNRLLRVGNIIQPGTYDFGLCVGRYSNDYTNDFNFTSQQGGSITVY